MPTLYSKHRLALALVHALVFAFQTLLVAVHSQLIPDSVPDYAADKKALPDWGFDQGPATFDVQRSETFTLDRENRPECDEQTEQLYHKCLGTETRLHGTLSGRSVELKPAGRGLRLEVKESQNCDRIFKAYAEKCVFEEFPER